MNAANEHEARDPTLASESVPSGSLLSHLHDGDANAADQIYQQYAGRLRQLAHAKLSKLLRSRLDADDIVQSVFRRFFAATTEGSYNCPTDEELWDVLLVITLNRLRTEEVFQRAGKRDVRRNVDMEAIKGLTSFANVNFSTSYLREGVAEALEQLPEHLVRVIRLRMEGFEVAEIAERVARSKRTVERLLQEALVQLRGLLHPEGDNGNEKDAGRVAGN